MFDPGTTPLLSIDSVVARLRTLMMGLVFSLSILMEQFGSVPGLTDRTSNKPAGISGGSAHERAMTRG